MLKEVEILVCLVFLLISVLLIFNARFFVRSKMDASNENLKVSIIKWLGAVLCAFFLVLIYYLR